MKLCLGTAQFGMDYGIRGQKQPSLPDAVKVLDYAAQNGIDTIDTASAYGDAEYVIGCWLRKNLSARKEIKLISKQYPNILYDVPKDRYYAVMKDNLEQSLSRLSTDHLDGYLLHSARYVFDDAIIEGLVRLKREGYADLVGVSVYEPEEAKKGINRGDLDFLQLPYSIFDQRMLHGGIFELAHEREFILHSRSAFIQGLILMEENEVPPFLAKAKPVIRKIDAFCRQNGLSRVQLAIGFVKRQPGISHLVFGVDSLEQLKEDIILFNRDIADDLVQEAAAQFTSLKADIVMPSLWAKMG